MIKIKSFGSGSKGNGYLLDDGQTQLMIECGIQFKKVQEQVNFDFSRVAGCIVTHEHQDHCLYADQLLDKTSVDIFATTGTIDGIKNLMANKNKPLSDYRFSSFNVASWTKRKDGQDIPKYQSKKIGTWTVTPFHAQHDANEPCGFLVDNSIGERLIFVTDSYYVKYKFKNLTHIMIEMNYDEKLLEENYYKKLAIRVKESHFSKDNALEFIRVNKSEKLQEVWLLHLSDSNSNEKEFKEETQKITGVPVFIA